MQTRIAFNGGEYTPELAARADLDKYPMGCELLENWDVGQFGGVSRRRGMQKVATAMSQDAALFPYVYSYSKGEDLRFLVEAGADYVRVLAPDGEQKAIFHSGDMVGSTRLNFHFEPRAVRYYQLNKLLFLTSLTQAPMVLSFENAKWVLEEWKFKNQPWRYTHLEPRETAVLLSYKDGKYSVDFGNAKDADTDKAVKVKDVLRVSCRMERREARKSSKELTTGVSIVTKLPESALAGDRFAIAEDAGCTYYVCIADFSETSGYVEGLESPANYANAFKLVDAVKGFESVTPRSTLKGIGSVKKGAKVAFKSEYWNYWTCIKDFTAGELPNFEDYPDYFVKGLAIDDAIPCRGTWAFKCSGVWYGEYEVRRCYDGSDLTLEWESRGVSVSYNDAPVNSGIEGDEKDEECYLRLFINRSRKLGDALIEGFPTEVNNNELVVNSYVHDVVLHAQRYVDDLVWSCNDLVKIADGARYYTKDWSWAAFSERYGYPLVCEQYAQRLVFAGTMGQPLTIWLSRVDDLNNFLEGETDDAGIALTLSAVSQDPICWAKSRKNDLLLGTSSSEYVVTAGVNKTSFTSSNAIAQIHSHRGSDGQMAVASDEKVLFIGRGGKRVYEYGYNYESDGYISRELSLLASHIGQEHAGLLRGTLLESPETVAVFALGDGQVGLCTYNSMQEVRAWHRWVTDGVVRDVCALPNGGKNDLLFLLVERDGEPNIEVVSEDAPYEDEGGRDYTSTLITNSLHGAVDKAVRTLPNTAFSVCFGDECDLMTGEVEVTTNGGKQWYAMNRNCASLEKGWHSDLMALSSNTFDRRFGIRVNGNRSLNLLAIQA